MRLKNRLALVIVLFLSTFVGCYSLLLLLEVPERANVETDRALPWVITLLPGRGDFGAGCRVDPPCPGRAAGSRRCFARARILACQAGAVLAGREAGGAE